MKVKALTHIKYKGVLHKPGSRFEVTKAVAEELLEGGVIEQLDGGVEDDSNDDDGSGGKATDPK